MVLKLGFTGPKESTPNSFKGISVQSFPGPKMNSRRRPLGARSYPLPPPLLLTLQKKSAPLTQQDGEMETTPPHGTLLQSIKICQEPRKETTGIIVGVPTKRINQVTRKHRTVSNLLIRIRFENLFKF